MRIFGESADLLRHGGIDVVELGERERELVRGLGLPEGPRADVHAHLGRDRDGHALSAEQLIEDMDRWGIGHAAVFALNDPGPDGTFSAANDGVLASVGRHASRLVPFCRIDPNTNWQAVLERAALGGARGLKLHPIAQRFGPADEAAIACVAAATANGWPVLIHAGYGARSLADPLVALLAAVPDARLILAHGARGDARAVRHALADHPGVWFDTSLAALADLVDLPPERLVFGADRPYGDYATALQLVALAARAAGWSVEQTRGVLAGHFAALTGS
jgi:predicted TIM-barrel fold metal-dependent hydrolase